MVEMGRGRGRRRWWMWVVAVLALVVGAYLLLQPRVVEISPPDGATDVSAGSSIEIQFNRPMNRASVERRLQTTPELAGSFHWAGDRLQFQANSPLPEGEIIQVQLQPGAISALSLPLMAGKTWRFQVSQPRVMYLIKREGLSQLEVRVLTEPSAETLVTTEHGIIDYDLAADTGILVTLERQQDASTSIVRRDLTGQGQAEIYRCAANERCLQPVISPGGRWLAWQQQLIDRGGTGILETGRWQVMVLALEDNNPPIIVPEPGEAHSPRWVSAAQLAAYSEERSALVVYQFNPNDDLWSALTAIPNVLGEQWSWSPEGRFVVFPEVILLEDGSSGIDFFSHLFRAEIDGGSTTDLSGPGRLMVEDASPAYSPDGLEIAFARKSLDPAEWTLGRQLWIMAADGTQVRPLTNDPNFNHASIRWHPTGSRLVYIRFNQAGLDTPSQIWWYDFSSDQHQMIVEGGFSPQWMP